MAITQVNGRWHSYKTEKEQKGLLADLYKDLKPEEREVVDQIIKDYGIKGESQIVETAYENEWDPNTGPPIPVRQWINDDYYLGETTKTLYPSLKEDLVEIFEGGYSEIILTGCIDKNARIMCEDGSMPSLRELIGKATRPLTVESSAISYQDSKPGVDSGTQEVLDLTLTNGMRVKLTPDHKVLTTRGWVRAQDLDIDKDRVLRARKVHYVASNHSLSNAEVKLLAYWVTDGSSSATRARYCDGNIKTGEEVIQSLKQCNFEATTPAPYFKNGAWEVHIKKHATSGFRDWLKTHGILAVGAHDRIIPDSICRAPLEQVGLFINRVWAAEGTVAVSDKSSPRFQIAMSSETFIQQLQLLLLRWGIQGRVHYGEATRNGTLCKSWTLQVGGKDNMELFLKHIGTIYTKEEKSDLISDYIKNVDSNTNVDVIPLTWGEAYDLLIENNLCSDGWHKFGSLRSRYLSRNMLNKFCDHFVSNEAITKLREAYPETVAYEKIKSIEKVIVPVEVADISVPHNTRFTANGISVHNSTRWGKDYLASTCIVRILYELLCLKNPQRALGLGAGERINIIPISHTKEAAKKVVFGTIAAKLNLAPFFRGRFEETLDEIRFKEKNIYISGGASGDQAALGQVIFVALLDEANFLGSGKATTGSASGEHYDRAQMIYEALARRIKNQFAKSGVKGMIFCLSSKKSTYDFTERRIKESLEDPLVFVRDRCTWLVRPENFTDQKWHTVVVSPKGGRSRVLPYGEEPPADSVSFKFPEVFLKEFLRDPDGATRDLAGICTDATNPFIVDRKSIEDMMKPGRLHPFGSLEWETDKPLEEKWNKVITINARSEPIPICCPGAQRHAHLDLSKNLCNTGLCMGHLAGITEVMRTDEYGKKRIEDAPIIHIDTVLEIRPPNGGEIDHEQVRNLLVRIREAGYPLRSVSMDQWCHTPNAQLLRKQGFKVDDNPLSVVRTLIPYISARNILYERRIESPVYLNLKEELYALELNKECTKVVKPRTSMKDLADAWAGVCFYLSEHITGGKSVMPSKGITESSFTANRAQSDGPMYIGNGDFVWPDEQPQLPNNPAADSGGLPTWIII